MGSSTKNDIEYYFDFNMKLLPLIGLRGQVTDKGSKISKFLEKLPTFLTNLLGIVCVASQLWLISDALPDNIPLSTKISSQLITNIQSICKGFQLANAIGPTRGLIRKIILNWKKHPSFGECQQSMMIEAQQSLVFCKIYFCVTCAVILAFGIPPLVNILLQYLARESTNHTYDYSQRVILVKYPYEINGIFVYLLSFFQEGYLLFASVMYWVNSDTLFVQFITHVGLQFKVLQYDVERLVNQENANEQLSKNFIEFSKRHGELLRICELINQIYGPIIFSSVLAAAINMCVNVVGLRDTISKGDYQETGIYLFLFISIFLQVFLYCNFAERLTQQSVSVADSIYNSKWTQKHYKFRTFVNFIVMRAQKPFYCSALGFFPIGHMQLSTVIRTSFSYYMMLETVNSQ